MPLNMRISMFAVDVALPAAIRGCRFCGQSVASPNTSWPEPPPLPPPPPPPLLPHAVNASVTAERPAISALPLWTFTCE